MSLANLAGYAILTLMGVGVMYLMSRPYGWWHAVSAMGAAAAIMALIVLSAHLINLP